jgi:hypothetical protein
VDNPDPSAKEKKKEANVEVAVSMNLIDGGGEVE